VKAFDLRDSLPAFSDGVGLQEIQSLSLSLASIPFIFQR
jgi:hypothetical protein